MITLMATLMMGGFRVSKRREGEVSGWGFEIPMARFYNMHQGDGRKRKAIRYVGGI